MIISAAVTLGDASRHVHTHSMVTERVPINNNLLRMHAPRTHRKVQTVISTMSAPSSPSLVQSQRISRPRLQTDILNRFASTSTGMSMGSSPASSSGAARSFESSAMTRTQINRAVESYSVTTGSVPLAENRSWITGIMTRRVGGS